MSEPRPDEVPDDIPDPDEPLPGEEDETAVVSESTGHRKEVDSTEGRFEGDPNTYPDPENPTRTP